MIKTLILVERKWTFSKKEQEIYIQRDKRERKTRGERREKRDKEEEREREKDTKRERKRVGERERKLDLQNKMIFGKCLELI